MKKKRASAKEVYTVADLQNWSEATRDVDPPIRLGVFGDPVAHSLSPQIQNAALRANKLQYVRFQISPNELPEALNRVRELDFIGVNLTIPHKVAALQLADDVDETARRVGAFRNGSIRTLEVTQ